MQNQNQGSSVIGIPITPLGAYPADDAGPAGEPELCDDCARDRDASKDDWIAKLRIRGIRRCARYLSMSRTERAFGKVFPVAGREEKLLESSRCHLSTTAGPIAGMLFISNEKIAFVSDRPLRLPSFDGNVAEFRYKVMIPLQRIESVIPVENVEMPGKKFVRIVTVDGFDFWFMRRVGGNPKFFNKLWK